MSGSIATLSAFTAGDLVVSISGDGNDSGTYGDNQASPITLEELTTTGTIVGELVLPQTTTIVNGVTEWAISGEYGSSSEGSLQLAANGQSLVIMGYGVNAATFNAGGAAVYGNAALAQSTSIPGGQYTAVARVVADIGYNATIDTSTALYNVYNTNNPRSVATVNGTTFYISGQGVKGDTTQGVFLAHDGASSATPIDTSTDTRTAEIVTVNGTPELYVSRDSTQGAGGTSNIASYGTTLPTSATAPTPLAGIDGTVTLTAAMENGVNDSDLGAVVNLSPENYFFASPTVLYVADGGNPKEGGLGDGGLQKWVLNDGTWTLEYTLSQGMPLVADTGTAGTTGLIGLTGTVVGDNVYLYATNSTIGDLDQTYVFGIVDSLASTTGDGESFTTLATAAADTNIRGISFAPSAPASTTPTVTTVASGVISSFIVVSSGSSLDVLNGGTAVAATILSGGTAVVSAGGFDIGTDIAQGGSETVLGSASGDFVDGVQLVSAATAVVSDEQVLNGGSVELFLKGAIANALTIETGGVLNISGNATASNTVIDGGLIEMASSKSVLSGAVTFSGAGTIAFASLTSGGYGDQAVISGFGNGDAIDYEIIGAGAVLTTSFGGIDTTATVTSGGVSQTLTFAGNLLSNLQLLGDGNGGEEITFSAPPPVSTVIAGGTMSSGVVVTSGSTLDVQSGGTAVAMMVQSGGFAQIESGGVDSAGIVSSGGNETVLGSATGDQIYGTQLVSNATAIVSNETVYNGGAVDLFLKGGIGNGLTVESGGAININGNATAEATVLSGGTIDLESPKAIIAGTVTFAGGGKIEITDTSSAGYGELAVISGFGAGDAVDWTVLGSGAALTTTLSGGNTVATVTSNGVSQSATFAGNVGSSLELVSDGSGGVEILYGSATSSSTATSVGSGLTESGLVISGGSAVNVLSGGTIVSATVLSGGSATIETGGFDSSTTIAAGGNESVAGSATADQVHGSQFVGGFSSDEMVFGGGIETVEATGIDQGTTIAAGGSQTVFGSASGDQVYGTQLVSAATAVVSDAVVHSGGVQELFIAGAIGSGTTVETGGTLAINGRGTAEATVLSGGSLILESPKATLSGTLTFAGPATLEETNTISPTSGGLLFGDQAVISGFGAGDAIDFSAATSVGAAGADASMTVTTSGGETLVTVTGDGNSQPFIFAGTLIGDSLALQSDGAGGEELVYASAAVAWAADEAGDFDDPSKWAGNAVPSGLTNAVIDFADDPQVLHDTGNDAVNSLTNEAGDFVMAGGTLTTPFLTNDALMAWTGGSLVLNTGAAATASLTNAAGATWTIQPDGQRLSVIGTGTASIANAGTILVGGATGEADIDALLTNTGQLTVTGGTLSLNGGGSSSGYGIGASGPGVLQFGTTAAGIANTFSIAGGFFAPTNAAISGGTLDASGASAIVFVDSLQVGAGALLLGSDNATDQGSMTQTGGSIAGSGTLGVVDGAVLTGGVITGGLTATLAGVSAIGGSFAVDGGATVENNQWLNWSSGNIALGSGDSGAATQTGTLTNNDVFYITSDGRITAGSSGVLAAGIGGGSFSTGSVSYLADGSIGLAGTSVVNNSANAVIAVYAGVGETDIDAVTDNAGYIQVQSGTLSLNGGGSSAGGGIYTAPDTVLQFGTTEAGIANTFSIAGGVFAPVNTVLNGGTLDASGASAAVFTDSLRVTSGALLLGTLAATDQGALTQTGGTIDGSGTLAVVDGASFGGGTLAGGLTAALSGVSTINGGVTLDGGVLANQQWLNWSSGNIALNDGGVLSNNAIMYVTADGRIATDGGAGTVANASNGVIAVYAAAGATNIDASVANSGYIQVQSGMLSLNGGGTSNAGNVFEAPGAVLQFGTMATGSAGTFAFSGGLYTVPVTDVTGGTVDFSAAAAVGFSTSLAVSGGAVLLGTLSATANTFGLTNGGSLSGSGTLTVAGAATLGAGLQTGGGTTVLQGPSSLGNGVELDGGRVLDNTATLAWTGGTLALGSGDPNTGNHAATLQNAAGALLEIEGDGTVAATAGSSILNAGTIEKLGAVGTTTLSAAVANTGTIEVFSGTIAFAQPVSGGGTFLLNGVAALEFAGNTGSGSSLQFLHPGGTLDAQGLGTFDSLISGFAAGDTIDAAGVGFVTGTTAAQFAGGTLTVANASQTAAFMLTGSYAAGSFQLASDGHGGTAITYT